MIVGIGTDLLEVERMVKALARTPGLAKRILTPLEQQQFGLAKQPARFLAKRFAAKEAAVKALGTGIGRGISWQHIEISHDALGKPLLQFSGAALQHAEALQVAGVHLSYSDEQAYVVAFVVLETLAVNAPGISSR